MAPGEDPALVDHVLREATMAGGAVPLEFVLERVAAVLDGAARAIVLSDLRRIAAADGRVTGGEEDLLALVERALGA